MRKVLYILMRLTDEDVDWFLSVGRRERLQAGTVVISEGKRVETLIFVLDGRLSITIAGVGEVLQLGSGEILGEISLVDENPSVATVTVVEPALVLSFDHSTLNAKLELDPEFAARFYRAIAMFLALQVRNFAQQLGYGKSRPSSQEEIHAEILDKVHIAGARFDRILKKLMTA